MHLLCDTGQTARPAYAVCWIWQTLCLPLRNFPIALCLGPIAAGVAMTVCRPATAAEALRVISLDVSNAPAIQAPLALVPEKPSWRTSFGSERESQAVPATPVAGLDADVVLLQGVTDIKAMYRTFPGRSWRLVVSRQMLASDDLTDPRALTAVSLAPVTAVAIRYQPGLRVAGQEHFMPRSEASGTREPLLADAPYLIAGTAVRLNIGGRFVWTASLALAPACAAPGTPCSQRDDFDVWRQAKLDAGEAVIAGGLRLVPIDKARAECDSQSIGVYPARKGTGPWRAPATPETGLGCRARAEAGGAAPDHSTAGAGETGKADTTPPGEPSR